MITIGDDCEFDRSVEGTTDSGIKFYISKFVFLDTRYQIIKYLVDHMARFFISILILVSQDRNFLREATSDYNRSIGSSDLSAWMDPKRILASKRAVQIDLRVY